VCESTITRTAGSCAASASAADNWATRADDSALRLCGLSNVSVATPRSTCTRTSSGTLDDMPSSLPDGEPVPLDGALPETALDRLGERGFGVYVHVPFCASRCGYCDFNTYTATELGGGATQAAYAETVLAEIALAAKVLAGSEERRPAAPAVS